MKLTTTWGKTYYLELIESNYTNNNKIYYGLIDKEDWESFCDITVNIPNGDKEENYIDSDFFLCFKDRNEWFEWLKKNLKVKEVWISYIGREYFKL